MYFNDNIAKKYKFDQIFATKKFNTILRQREEQSNEESEENKID